MQIVLVYVFEGAEFECHIRFSKKQIGGSNMTEQFSKLNFSNKIDLRGSLGSPISSSQIGTTFLHSFSLFRFNEFNKKLYMHFFEKAGP